MHVCVCMHLYTTCVLYVWYLVPTYVSCVCVCIHCVCAGMYIYIMLYRTQYIRPYVQFFVLKGTRPAHGMWLTM